MDIRKIRKLIELINETGVNEIEVKSGDDTVRISRFPTSTTVQAPSFPTFSAFPAQPAAHPSPEIQTTPVPEVQSGHLIKSPMVGTVYLAATPGAKPFVAIGQRVSAGDTLCLIEAMKMFNKIEADTSGVLSARLIENEQPVEYDQTLFIIDPDG